MRKSDTADGVLIGVSVGVGCLLLLPVLLVVAVVLLIVVGRTLNPIPIPDGEPLLLRAEQIAGTWRDDTGGRLVLRADGTFTSDGVCGDFNDQDLGDARAPDPGAGTWLHREGDDVETGDPMSEVHLTFTPSEVWTEYEARGTAEKHVLWQYIGDPDLGDLCVLQKATG